MIFYPDMNLKNSKTHKRYRNINSEEIVIVFGISYKTEG